LGVGVDPDHAGHFDVDPGLLLDLADHRVGHELADVHGAAGQRPQVVVGLVHQQQLAALVGHDRGNGGDDAVGLGGVGVVEVVDPSHRYRLSPWASTADTLSVLACSQTRSKEAW
jgi:hypothetical protein